MCPVRARPLLICTCGRLRCWIWPSTAAGRGTLTKRCLAVLQRLEPPKIAAWRKRCDAAGRRTKHVCRDRKVDSSVGFLKGWVRQGPSGNPRHAGGVALSLIQENRARIPSESGSLVDEARIVRSGPATNAGSRGPPPLPHRAGFAMPIGRRRSVRPPRCRRRTPGSTGWARAAVDARWLRKSSSARACADRVDRRERALSSHRFGRPATGFFHSARARGMRARGDLFTRRARRGCRDPFAARTPFHRAVDGAAAARSGSRKKKW